MEFTLCSYQSYDKYEFNLYHNVLDQGIYHYWHNNIIQYFDSNLGYAQRYGIILLHTDLFICSCFMAREKGLRKMNYCLSLQLTTIDSPLYYGHHHICKKSIITSVFDHQVL